MSLNLGDQIRDIVLSMQANGTLMQRTTMQDTIVPPAIAIDLLHASDEKPGKLEVTETSFDGWSNGNATTIPQRKTKSSLHE